MLRGKRPGSWRGGSKTGLSLEWARRLKLRATLQLLSSAQNLADKGFRHRLAGIARVFRYQLGRTNCQLISFQIVRASGARPPVLQERSTINIAQFIVS